MKISLVTDEISADLETAVELAAEWGVRNLELRGYGANRVPLFSSFQKQRLHELLEEYGMQVVAISPGLFKFPCPPAKRDRFPLQVIDADLFHRWENARSLLERQLHELLPASIEFAKSVDARKIIAFSFEKGPAQQAQPPEEVIFILQEAAELVGRDGLDLLIEVEAGFWADTGAHTAELIQAVNHPALGVNWDPGNAIATGEPPFPQGYASVKQYIRHVHFKDALRQDNGDFHYVIEGGIDWRSQICTLAEDGYDGFISVEPHMRPKVASTKRSLERLKGLLTDAEPVQKSMEAE